MTQKPGLIDRTLVLGDLLFATHRDRCCYIGLSARNQLLWQESNGGKWQRIQDVQKEAAPLAPPVDTETKVAAAPAGPNGQTSPRHVQKDGDDKDDVALADTLLGDCSRPCEPTSLPTPVKENAKKQKPPTGISRSTPKLSPELMRIVLNSLRKYPVLWHAASKAGIHRKALEYWIRCSAAGHDGYDLKWQGIDGKFHEHCESAIWEAEQKLEDEMLQRALSGYDKVLTHRGRVMYKIDPGLVGLGFQGPNAYLRDENGNPVPETVHKDDTKAQLSVLKRLRRDRWGKRPKIDGPREGGVLVIGDVTKKPKYNTAASVRARKWKADSRRIREEKD
jgi:hypothetical protein